MQNPAFLAEQQTPGTFLGVRGWGTEFSAYLLLTLLIVLGWLLRDLDLITPDNGVGYWLGIIGGTLMLLLLLYPLRKRMKLLHRLGTPGAGFNCTWYWGCSGRCLSSITATSNSARSTAMLRSTACCWLPAAALSGGIYTRIFTKTWVATS